MLNNGKTRRTTHIDDTIDGIIKCLNFKNEKRFHDLFNLGTGKTYSILELSKIIGELLNINFKIICFHHPTDMTVTKSNMTKSRKFLN